MKKFLEFLKKNDALDNFLDACPDMDVDPREYISCSFAWHNTPQGFHYWKNLSDLWRNELYS